MDDDGLPSQYFRGISYSNESRYEGGFENNQKQGFGILTFADGSGVAGQFENGMPQGFGVANMANGACYAGTFANGLFEGYGVYVRPNRTEFIGTFRAGVLKGFGMLVSETGDCELGWWSGPILIKPQRCDEAIAAARASATAANALVEAHTRKS
eukprot:m.117394 g.117394  ORF g.117394 m.117394 type:complete len:155 (+) comp15545_c0_seq7:28-492(+)